MSYVKFTEKSSIVPVPTYHIPLNSFFLFLNTVFTCVILYLYSVQRRDSWGIFKNIVCLLCAILVGIIIVKTVLKHTEAFENNSIAFHSLNLDCKTMLSYVDDQASLNHHLLWHIHTNNYKQKAVVKEKNKYIAFDLSTSWHHVQYFETGKSY